MKDTRHTTWHDIKDLVMIYHEFEWDDAKVTVWNPNEKKEYKLIFCGSSRPNEETNERGEINFIISPIDEE